MKTMKKESIVNTLGSPSSIRRAATIKTIDEDDDSIIFGGEDVLSLITRLSKLEKDLERRKASYSNREDSYKQRISQLEDEINNQSYPIKKNDPNLYELKAIHQEILDSVEMVQDRTARIMQEQESDLLRSFRARLFDVQTELEKEKSKRDDGLVIWREKYSQLEAELDWATEVSNRLDKVNYTLTKENNELKTKFTSQEQDRTLFIELLVNLKKDNALWRTKNTDLLTENENLKLKIEEQLEILSNIDKALLLNKTTANHAATPIVSPTNNNNNYNNNNNNNAPNNQKDPIQQRVESEERFKDVNIRLRRLVAEERRTLTQLRQSYAQELKTRTEMEQLLRKCVEDVREAIADKHHELAQFAKITIGTDVTKLYSTRPGSTPFEAFDHEEEQRTLELLLSQERVISLIYTRAFPILNSAIGIKGQGKSSPNSFGFGIRPGSTPAPPHMLVGGIDAILANIDINEEFSTDLTSNNQYNNIDKRPNTSNNSNTEGMAILNKQLPPIINNRVVSR